VSAAGDEAEAVGEGAMAGAAARGNDGARWAVTRASLLSAGDSMSMARRVGRGSVCGWFGLVGGFGGDEVEVS
jgi:hypothetical protein